MYYLFGYKNTCKMLAESVNANNFNPDSLADREKLVRLYIHHGFIDRNESVEQTQYINKNRCKTISTSTFQRIDKHTIDIQPTILESNILNTWIDSIQDEYLKSLIKTVVRYSVVTEWISHTNGTVAENVGIGTMNFKAHYGKWDLIELQFHQFIHFLVFIDDLKNNQVNHGLKDKIIKSKLDNRFGGKEFKLYLAFHSLVVGVEVLFLRAMTERLNFPTAVHGKTEMILNNCKHFLDMLYEYKTCFTSHGQVYLTKMSKALDLVNSELKRSFCEIVE